MREITANPIGWTVIPLTFTSSVECSRFSKQYTFITIPTQVLIVKHHPEFPNHIMLGFDWFTGRKYDDEELQIYRAEIVTDAEDGWVRTTLRIKNLAGRKGKSIVVPVYYLLYTVVPWSNEFFSRILFFLRTLVLLVTMIEERNQTAPESQEADPSSVPNKILTRSELGQLGIK